MAEHVHNIVCMVAREGKLVCQYELETEAQTALSAEGSPDVPVRSIRDRQPASLRRDSTTGRAWLMFDGRPGDEEIAALKAGGWRWSGYRKEWHNPSRFAFPPEGIPFVDDGFVDYAEERGERLAGRAAKHAEAGSTAYGKFEQISSGIPLGQPILVGHHSERRHRRDLERIRRFAEKSVEESREAARLRETATSSRRHQERMKSPGVVARRIDRLRREVKKIEENLANLDEMSPLRAKYARHLSLVQSDLMRNESLLMELGGLPAQSLAVEAGDLVRMEGNLVRVRRVNPKTISGTIEGGGAHGWPVTRDKSQLQEIVEKGPGRSLVSTPKTRRPGALTEREKMERFVWSKTQADYRGTIEGRKSVMLPASMDGGLAFLDRMPAEQLTALARDRGWPGGQAPISAPTGPAVRQPRAPAPPVSVVAGAESAEEAILRGTRFAQGQRFAVGESVIAHWTSSGTPFRGRGTVVRIERTRMRVRLDEHVPSPGGFGWPPGHEIVVPTISAREWSESNRAEKTS